MAETYPPPNAVPFLQFPISPGLLHAYDDGNYKTHLHGFSPGHLLPLSAGYTHFGVVAAGRVVVSYQDRRRELVAGDYFSAAGEARVQGEGLGIVTSAFNYEGSNVFGGPIETHGRLRYIDGCSDTLLIPPVKKGDPCLNYLHFPKGIDQTAHTHPSARIGIIYRGSGKCRISDAGFVALQPEHAFIIPTNVVHSFHTAGETMDVIVFHPDSDVGMTDDDHPMINRTFVDGVSAKFLDEIRTVR